MAHETPKTTSQPKNNMGKKNKHFKKLRAKKSSHGKNEERSKKGNEALLKVTKGPITTETTIKTKVAVPKTNDEASSNWRNLCTKLAPNKPFKRKVVMLQKVEEAKCAKTALSDGAKSTGQSESAQTVWFDDVDPLLLSDTEEGGSHKNNNRLPQVVALDCEMVGIGEDGKESALARVSIVNHHGECIYDKYVKPGEEVTDFRTEFSGIRPHDLLKAIDLGTVCHEVSNILRGKILVGHGLKNDLQALMIRHPKTNIRDTSKYKHFRSVVNGATPSLKKLTQKFLGVEIQSGEHNPIQDAQAAMRLYMMFRTQWETDRKVKKSERKCRIVARKLPTDAIQTIKPSAKPSN